MNVQYPMPEPKVQRSSVEWVRELSKYRDPNHLRSAFELVVSLLPFILLWAIAWWSMSISYFLTLGISVLNALFLVRIFCIQHDCGHGSFFRNRALSDWVGRGLGILTLTPYDVWRRSHAIHHSHAGNLDHRGIGDIMTLTVDEYHNRSWVGKLMYRLYRHPVITFGLGPAYVFLLENRLPLGYMNSGWRYWTSAMGTNVAITVILGVMFWLGGIMPLLLIFLPTSVIASALGVWLFYVQHQFEETHWDKDEDWHMQDAALHGSSHYVMPSVLQWFTANIGVHHVHHLYSRIPFYRLTEVLRDHGELAEAQRLTIMESFKCVRLKLWDEKERRLLTIKEANRRLTT